jgi:group I intron endonuclease
LLFLFIKEAKLLKKKNYLNNKHNLKNFSLYILEYCSPEDVIKREQYYLDTYKPIYNILKIIGSSLGYVHNKISLAKIHSRFVSKATFNKMKQRKQSEEAKDSFYKAIGIPVKVMDIDKEEITIYISKRKAQKLVNIIFIYKTIIVLT